MIKWLLESNVVLYIRVGERQVQGRGESHLNNLVLPEENGQDGMDLAAMAEVKWLSFWTTIKVRGNEDSVLLEDSRVKEKVF